MTTRRQFLQSAAGSAAAIGCTQLVPDVFMRASRAAGKTASERILVVIQLNGGNDGLNTIVPYGDVAYYRNRYSLGIGKGSVLKIDGYAGFHPQLRGCADLLEAGHLAIVQGVGYPGPNRSHFESMDLWNTAHCKQGQIPEGWIGSYLRDQSEQLAALPAMHLGQEDQPLALSNADIRVPSIASLKSFNFAFNQRANLKQSVMKLVDDKRESGNDLLNFLQTSTQSALKTSHQVESVLGKYKTRQQYPSSGLAQKLRTVAQLIGAGLETNIFYVTLSGFDTHANQQQSHAGLLGQFSNAVASFMKDLGDQGNLDRVALMAFSEFGRRVKENASHGTDHGAAAPLFVAGGKVNAGLLGKQPSLTDLEDGDLKFHTDYRRVYATMLEKWLGVASEPILGDQFQPLNLFAS